VLGLYAAGEAVGGANGANRLSGNALVEAFVFGERAGRFSAIFARSKARGWSNKSGIRYLDALNSLISCKHSDDGEHAELGQIWAELQNLMWQNVGVLRTGLKLEKTLLRLQSIRANLEKVIPAKGGAFNLTLQDWFDLRSGLLTAEAVTLSALNRTESRGAHQREDFTETKASFEKNQSISLDMNGSLNSSFVTSNNFNELENAR